MKHWETTLGGLLAGVGSFITMIDDPSAPWWLKYIGGGMNIAGTVILGGFAVTRSGMKADLKDSHDNTNSRTA